MAHTHPVVDDDLHFIIDPDSRDITHPGEKLPTIIQFDHNSERFTFEIPSEIDGHDMMQCNSIEIHFDNINKAKPEEINHGMNLVTDLAPMPDDNTKLVFSWLIDQSATYLAGPLDFAIRFACTHSEEDVDVEGNPIVVSKLDYSWNTHTFTGIMVSDGKDNNLTLHDTHFSAVSTWTETINQAGKAVEDEAVTVIANAQSSAIQDVKKIRDEATTYVDQHVEERVEEAKAILTEDALNIADVVVQEIDGNVNSTNIPSTQAVQTYVDESSSEISANMADQFAGIYENMDDFRESLSDVIINNTIPIAMDVSEGMQKGHEYIIEFGPNTGVDIKILAGLNYCIVHHPSNDNGTITYTDVSVKDEDTYVHETKLDVVTLQDNFGICRRRRFIPVGITNVSIGKKTTGNMHACANGDPILLYRYTITYTVKYIMDDEEYSHDYTVDLNDANGTALLAPCNTDTYNASVADMEEDILSSIHWEIIPNGSVNNQKLYEYSFFKSSHTLIEHVGIKSITTIVTTDGKKARITLENGAIHDVPFRDGIGIREVILTDKGDYEDTYEVHLNNGTIAATFKIPNGNSSGIKTSTSGPIIRAEDVIPVSHRVNTKLRNKNILEPRYTEEIVISGITITPNDDSSITVNGTASEIMVVRFINTTPRVVLKPGTYTFSIGSAVPNSADCYIIVEDYIDGKWNSQVARIDPGKNTCTFTLLDETHVAAYLNVPKNTVIDNLVLYPQIEEAPTATPYTPYVDLSTVTLTKCGKNIVPYPHAYGTGTIAGITYTVNTDGTVTATGTATVNSIQYMVILSNGTLHLPKGTYTLSGCPSGGSMTTYRITIKRPNEKYHYDIGEGCTFTLEEDDDIQIYIFIGEGTTVNALEFKPQIEVGSTATGYEPYTATKHLSYSDGTLNVMPYSISPTMTLLTDKTGVIIDTVYNRDQTAVYLESGTGSGSGSVDLTEVNEQITALNTKVDNINKQPDWNEDSTSSHGHILNRPFYDAQTIEYTIDGDVSVTLVNGLVYRCTEDVIYKRDLSKWTANVSAVKRVSGTYTLNTTKNVVLSDEYIVAEDEYGICIRIPLGYENGVMFIVYDYTKYSGGAFPTNGVYIGESHTGDTSSSDYTMTVIQVLNQLVVKTLDNKYIDLQSNYDFVELDAKVGDISTALDELHSYAQALVNGGDSA